MSRPLASRSPVHLMGCMEQFGQEVLSRPPFDLFSAEVFFESRHLGVGVYVDGSHDKNANSPTKSTKMMSGVRVCMPSDVVHPSLFSDYLPVE